MKLNQFLSVLNLVYFIIIEKFYSSWNLLIETVVSIYQSKYPIKLLLHQAQSKYPIELLLHQALTKKIVKVNWKNL